MYFAFAAFALCIAYGMGMLQISKSSACPKFCTHFFFFFTSHVDGVSKTLSTCIVSKVVESAQKIVQQIPELFEHYGADLLLWCQKCIIKCAKKWHVLAQTHLLCVNLQRLDSKRVQSASTKCQSRNI